MIFFIFRCSLKKHDMNIKENVKLAMFVSSYSVFCDSLIFGILSKRSGVIFWTCRHFPLNSVHKLYLLPTPKVIFLLRGVDKCVISNQIFPLYVLSKNSLFSFPSPQFPKDFH
jgi:hypothetical protein